MKEYRHNSIISTRNSLLEKRNKKEISILANKQHRKNNSNLSLSRISDGYNQKLGNVKIRIEKQYEVIILKFRN